jgi:hypothetical protein
MKSLFLFFSLSLSVFFSSCNMFGEQIEGNGNIKTETRSASGFTGVEAGGSINLYLTQAAEYTVRIEADENLMEFIEVRTYGDLLRIKPKDNFNLRSSKKIKVYVSAPSYKHIGASGACDIFSVTKLTSPDAIDLDLSGASNITLELNSPKVNADFSGSSSFDLKGETKDLNIDGSGASEARCYDLLAENVDVDMSGASSAEVYASVSLRAGLSGASHVKYKGKASVNQNTSGASSVSKTD